MRAIQETDNAERRHGIGAEHERAEWLSLAHEIGFTNDFSFEALLDRLERVVSER